MNNKLLGKSRQASAGRSGRESLYSRHRPWVFVGLALAVAFANSVFTNTAFAENSAVAETSVAAKPPVQPKAPFVKDGKAGFVVSSIKYALADGTPDLTVACPDGMSLQVQEIFAMAREGKRKPGESDADYGKRLEEGGKALSIGPKGENLCLNPEVAEPDPHYRTMKADSIPVFGIDLDRPTAHLNGKDKPASCPHVDLPGIKGEQGIDNQFYRLVGCTRSHLPEGQSNSFEVEMLTGSWGILFTLEGIDDLRNDDEVKVGLYASADPIQLSPTRIPLAYATYAIDQDPRFRATTTGRIQNGVLITEPVDVRFRYVVNSMRLERPLKDARLQVTLSEEGALDGYLGGYTLIEELYDFKYGYRKGKGGDGKLAPLALRLNTANGSGLVLGHTCAGVYQAMHKLADGHPDPETGACTTLSMQYQVKAIPAFVVDVASTSKNQQLKEKLRYDDGQ